MKRLHIVLQVELVVDVEDTQVVSDFVNELEFSFTDTTGNVTIIDETINEFEVTDAR